MKIVIDIPEERYKDIQRIAEVQIGLARFQTAEQIIANGTPLPKNHGRLIDADDVTDFEGHYITTDAPTIIEADKENKE